MSQSPRSGRYWIDRLVEQRAVRELGFADSGLMCRIWMDVAHRPRIVRLAGGEAVRLEAWQALVSVSEYGRESGSCRAWIRKALGRLQDAGWVGLQGTPAGVVVSCLVRPSGEVLEPSAEPSEAVPGAAERPSGEAENPPADGPSGGGGGGTNATRGVAPMLPGGWHQCYQGGGSSGATTVDTPSGDTPAVSTPAGPKSCITGGGSYQEPSRARDNAVARPLAAAAPAPVPVLAPAAGPRPGAELHPVTSAACRAAGVPCGEALELLCRGYDEPRILARALMLAAKLRQGFRPRSATAWLRDKVARGHGDIGLHETAKRMLGSSAPLLPLNWIEPQTRGAPVPTPVGELLRRAAGGA